MKKEQLDTIFARSRKVLSRNRRALSRFLRAAGCVPIECTNVPQELSEWKGNWRTRSLLREWEFTKGTLADFYKSVTSIFAPKNRKTIYQEHFSPSTAFALFLLDQVPGTEIEGKRRGQAMTFISGKKPGRKHGEETLRRVRLRNEKKLSHGQIADEILSETPNLTPAQKSREKILLTKEIGKTLKAYRDSMRDKEYFEDPRKIFLGLRRGDSITILEIDGGKESA